MADAAYGLWPLVILNTVLFVALGLSFFHPRTKRDGRIVSGYIADRGIGWAFRLGTCRGGSRF